jgi:hypothetical protein
MSASANAAGYLAMSAAVTAAVRNVSANRNRAGDSTLAPYSPECVELEFCELRANGVLRSSYCSSPTPISISHQYLKVYPL